MATAPVNGRPWFVFFDAATVGIVHFGTFMVPFQPSNEAEELTLQATPWNYRQFPTQAAAQAWINGPEGQRIKKAQHLLPTAGGPGNPLSSLTGVTQFLSNLTQRDFWVRVAKVIIGGAMVIVGLAQLSGAGKALSNVKVLPV